MAGHSARPQPGGNTRAHTHERTRHATSASRLGSREFLFAAGARLRIDSCPHWRNDGLAAPEAYLSVVDDELRDCSYSQARARAHRRGAWRVELEKSTSLTR